MYIDKMIVWITMRYAYIRKMLYDCKVANLQIICYVF
jgi:hypothetical protein